MSQRQSKVRRSLTRLRRGRAAEAKAQAGSQKENAPSKALAVRPRPDDLPAPPSSASTNPSSSPSSSQEHVGWDHDAHAMPEAPMMAEHSDAPLTAQVLSLLADPRLGSVTVGSATKLLGRPRADVQNALDALVQAGELIRTKGSTPRYGVVPERKAQLEAMFRDAAQELGETTALVRAYQETALAQVDDDEEPRLPVTAGLLSLFLPGTGQLLNGDVGRASLVFAVWSLALLTHLSPIWTFVALYAGAEAFFTAKIRSMERKLALESASTPKAPPALKPSKT